jgi:C1A family cysteine protease
VAAVESKYLIEHTDGWIPDEFFDPPDTSTAWNPPDLSEQALVSGCTDAWGDCTGGSKNDALDAIRDQGIVDEACMPYTSESCLDTDDHCICGSAAHCGNPSVCTFACDDTGYSEFPSRTWTIDSHHYLEGTNTVANLKRAVVCQGPLAVSSNDWGHCVLIVGWENDSEICRTAYPGDEGSGGCWIVKNSHGDSKTGFSRSSSDKYDEHYYTDKGFVWIPFEGHDYSAGMRNNNHYVNGVNPPTSWVWP